MESISAAILTASFLEKTKGTVDEYMKIYAEFLQRIEGVHEAKLARSDEATRRKSNSFYDYKRAL